MKFTEKSKQSLQKNLNNISIVNNFKKYIKYLAVKCWLLNPRYNLYVQLLGFLFLLFF